MSLREKLNNIAYFALKEQSIADDLEEQKILEKVSKLYPKFKKKVLKKLLKLPDYVKNNPHAKTKISRNFNWYGRHLEELCKRFNEEGESDIVLSHRINTLCYSRGAVESGKEYLVYFSW